MRAKQEDIVKEREKQIALNKGETARLEDDTGGKGKKKKKYKQASYYIIEFLHYPVYLPHQANAKVKAKATESCTHLSEKRKKKSRRFRLRLCG